MKVSGAELEVGRGGKVWTKPRTTLREQDVDVSSRRRKGGWGGSVFEFHGTAHTQCKAADSKNPSDSLINWN